MGLTLNYKLVDLFESKNNSSQRQSPRTNRFGGSGDFRQQKWKKTDRKSERFWFCQKNKFQDLSRQPVSNKQALRKVKLKYKFNGRI